MSNNSAPRDANYSPELAGLSPSNGWAAIQLGGTTGTDSATGNPYAPAAIVGANTPADGLAIANGLPTVRMEQTGTNVVSPVRTPNVFKTVAAQAITAGTPFALWTPATGKKFRLMNYSLSLSVAGYLIFKDGSSVVLNSANQATAGAPNNSAPMGNGILSTTANNILNLDVSASGNVTGWVCGIEE